MFSIVIQIFVLFHSVSSRKCDKDFDIRLSTVIITHVSENNGAAFIHKLSADSLEECIKYCCDTIECTVGVFGPKRGGKCFLFNCHEPNTCNFTSDPDYTVFVQRTWLPEQRNVHKVATWSSGSLFGLCGPRDPCVVANTICDSGRCVCKSGFVEKRRKCVPSICSKPELEFQCDDATSCIAIYDVCNRIAECPDASDESLCGEAEPVDSVSTHKVQSQSSPGSRTLNARTLLPRGDDEHDLSEVDFESSKVRSLRTLHFGRDSPIHRTYEGEEVYFPPSYLTSSLETDVPSLMLTGARGKSVFPANGVSTFLEQPEHLRSRSGYRSHLSGSFRFSDEDASLEHHRRKIGRLSTQAHGTLVEDFDEAEKYNIPHYRGSGFDREHKVLRHRVRPLAEHSDLKSDDKHRTDKYHEEAKDSAMRPKMPAAPVIGLYSQSGYQWHTAAILLAVGLGLTSCLFGLLVSRCRQRGRFDQGGPRSKAVATNHLRQRILRTRGLSSNDLERSGLLSKLQL